MKPRVLRHVLAILLGLGALLYARPRVCAAARVNAALILLARDWSWNPTRAWAAVSPSVITQLESAAAADPARDQVRWHLGVLYLLTGDEQRAFDTLPQAQNRAERALERGSNALSSGLTDRALLWFAIGSTSSDLAGVSATSKLARLCLSLYASRAELSALAQCACDGYWHPPDGNLLANGQFEQGLIGWSHLVAADQNSVTYDVDEAVGTPEPSLRITGRAEGYHGGLFQSLLLPPGTVLEYSLHYKAEPTHGFSADFLVWQIGASEQHVRAVPSTDSWNSVTTTLAIPDGDNVLVLFAPVRVYGKGSVWVDDVSVAVIGGG